MSNLRPDERHPRYDQRLPAGLAPVHDQRQGLPHPGRDPRHAQVVLDQQPRPIRFSTSCSEASSSSFWVRYVLGPIHGPQGIDQVEAQHKPRLPTLHHHLSQDGDGDHGGSSNQHVAERLLYA